MSDKFDSIDDAIQRYPDSHYPLLSKASMAARRLDLEKLCSAYNGLESMSKARSISKNSLARLKARLLVLDGNIDKAISYAEDNLQRCPEFSQQSFIDRLQDMNTQMQIRNQ